MLDQKDQKILEILRTNSRLSNTEIARMLNVSEGTIRKRIARLISTGTIKGFTIVPGNQMLISIILIKVDPEYSASVLKQLKESYEEVYEWSGQTDFSVRLFAESLDVINEQVNRIRNLEGVLNTDTLIRLS